MSKKGSNPPPPSRDVRPSPPPAPPHPYGSQHVAELRAIHDMFVVAAEQGLSCEVVFEFGHLMVSTGGLVHRSCAEARKRSGLSISS